MGRVGEPTSASACAWVTSAQASSVVTCRDRAEAVEAPDDTVAADDCVFVWVADDAAAWVLLDCVPAPPPPEHAPTIATASATAAARPRRVPADFTETSAITIP